MWRVGFSLAHADLAMIETLLVVGIVIVLTSWYVRRNIRRRELERAERSVTGLQVLETRYACGEIDRDEYLEKRGDILGYPLTSPSSHRAAARRAGHEEWGSYRGAVS